MGKLESQPRHDKSAPADIAALAEATARQMTLRFSLRTVFGVSLLFAAALAVVAIFGRDWTLEQHAAFMIRFCVWMLAILVWLYFYLWVRRRYYRKLGGLIQAFGGPASSRAWRIVLGCCVLLTFVVAIGFFIEAGNGKTGEMWLVFDWLDYVFIVNWAVAQAGLLGGIIAREGFLLFCNSVISVSQRMARMKKLRYEDIASSHWSAEQDHVLTFHLRKGASLETTTVKVRAADQKQVDSILLAKLGNRHVPR